MEPGDMVLYESHSVVSFDCKTFLFFEFFLFLNCVFRFTVARFE
jgi:hypothetical protein